MSEVHSRLAKRFSMAIFRIIESQDYTDAQKIKKLENILEKIDNLENALHEAERG